MIMRSDAWLRVSALAALVAAGTIVGTGDSAGQTPAAPVAPRTAPLVQTPLPEPSAIEEAADSIFSGARSIFRSALSRVTDFVSPPSAVDVARRTRQTDPYDFVAMMDLAGYKLKEVESSVALIPTVSFVFGMARELSDADREWLALQLERHARKRSGLFASAERNIVQSLLDAQELGGYQVEKLEVNLFPWPQVKFLITPSDAPMSEEGSRIMRAIEVMNESIKAAAKSAPGKAGEPVAGPPPANAGAPAAESGVPAAAPRTGVQQRSITP